MPFKRNVEIGRVALVNFGEDSGKLLVIVDVLDMNRVLVDAPGITRGSFPLKRLSLTDIKVDIERCPKKAVINKVAPEAFAKFVASSWGQKLERAKAKAALSDFDRYKVMVARVKKSAIVKRELAKLK
mmetsp:Transcript_10682/g.12490  ORF Transcript_10682/g.12490 Transcript_10682/m.12490 type:complete len:128 (-) Transcript_10682:106-489(-)|eukprot:CAMPEP_0197843674 /NCGR_PEP_ID=MMETSP1438-20131217/582_1 /TAXON_ID=1461541 /ORGANISM="Pterosperma sp., Strain CCMP1384" /LENGTH=127 /DNA_ID=CAMNT_0043453975 /DNA_START=175 /DNA_END=558 /DNA_ORIENTATION=+